MADSHYIECPTCGKVFKVPPCYANKAKHCSRACRTAIKSDSLSAERLREVLDYNAITGVFTWKVRRGKSIAPGSIAGGGDGMGYIRIKIDWKRYKAHRLAWFYTHGEWPTQHIDHINGIRSDNRIANLRDVSNQINSQNVKKARSNSKSGILGVKPVKGTSKWVAAISVSGVKTIIGKFDSKEEAGMAYLKQNEIIHVGFVA